MAEKQKQPAPDRPAPEPVADPRIDAMLAEIAELKAKLARSEAASRQYTPATPAAGFPAGPLKPYMVSLNHIHAGLTTPSPWFAREKPGDPRGLPIMATCDAHARAIFQELHGIVGFTGPGPEAREMDEAELESGEWAAPPAPGPKHNQRLPEKPKPAPRLKRDKAPDEDRQAALAQLTNFAD